MGFLSNLRRKGKIEQALNEYFQLMTGYIPRFTTFEGGIYEMELTRAAVHSFATHVSKLHPEIKGNGNENIERTLQYRPNQLMDTKKYLYRLATVYMVDNTAFIVPLYDQRMANIVGFYPLDTSKVQITAAEGTKYLVYDFGLGDRAAIELDRTGIMTQFQYHDELFGESNRCMKPTMDLIHANNQGIIEGVKNAASIRFMGKLAQVLKPADIDAERERFVTSNLSSKNSNGILLFDQKYEDVKQVTSEPFVVDDKQMSQIKDNVFNYFGTNENILQNKFTSDEWNAYYEGKIEPFAIEASLIHTNMLFNDLEIASGNEVIFSANRLQYMSNKEQLEMITSLFDRGFLSQNEGREILNMPPVEDGDKYYIRKEYCTKDMLEEIQMSDMAAKVSQISTGEEKDAETSE
jgi:HK97 family phage portal protein